MMKYLGIGIVAVVVGVGAYLYLNHSSIVPKKSATNIAASFQKTKEINRFYTGVYHVPALHKNTGVLKRDMVKEGVKTYLNPFKVAEKAALLIDGKPLINEDEAKRVVKGYCFKKYEVAFGYDNLMQLLENQELISAVCTNKLGKLPDPKILAVNCKSTDTHGKYDTAGACYGWDSNDAERKKIIRQAMAEDGILDKVNSRGKESLKNFLTVLCN